jgi:hypothetical protein
MKKGFLIILGLAFIILCGLILKPVPILPEEECLVTSGVVVNIFEGGVKDVVFHLQGDSKSYYINRGLENGLNLQELKNELIGKHVTFKYPDHWTPLDPQNQTIHLSKVEVDNDVVYSEIR